MRRTRSRVSALPVLLPVLLGCVGAGTAMAPASGTEAMLANPFDPRQQAPVPTLPALGLELIGEPTQGGLVTGRAPADAVALLFNGKPVPLAADRRFIVGFDRDAAPLATLVATLADGTTVTRSLAIAPRQWNISRLPTLAKVPVPHAEFDARRPAELARIAAARALVTDAAGWRQRFVWPLTGRISTRFGSQRIYADGEAGAYHSGIDIARATGTVVRVPADGVVVLAADAPFTLEGNLLLVDHGAGLTSAFLHLSRIDVAVGAHVRQGDPIGLVGATGRATGPHLHWGIQWRGARLDPLLVAGAMPRATPINR